ncbi:potassium-transporting ATPase subunit C [Streptomyces sp. 5-8]|uniref:Potassium-transporting ATPase KdpC subunit n=1 Tax=Streptomyces musisoli TaxID=2802280 RepID=A0ABS1P3W0_9ACTN|nr:MULTISPECIES: potassium-transporting ATPase subunit C [Streptomyces]MBL1106993.1 potassium-transporting ATPase subunit C [Streptomyces musisoli]MBY8841870.1 potassium-transporting ATPase subunit C [Streptomyces sp. SP2-10]
MNNSFVNTSRLLGAGLRALLVLTLVTGVIYPLVVTGIAQALFHDKANGSEIEADGRVVGSSLIGQPYNLPLKKGQQTPEPDLRWFQGRPADGLGGNSINTRYELILSGATNLAADSGAVDGRCPAEPEDGTLCARVLAAKAAVVEDNSVAGYPVQPSDVPADAVTSSGSGLDPAISPQYAGLQVHRVAARNGLSVAAVEKLVADHTQGRTLGFIGEPQVNVLELNIALEDLVAGK